MATQNYLAKFDASGNATADSVAYDNGTKIGIGETTPQSRLHVKSTDAEVFRIQRSGGTHPGVYTFSSTATMTGDSADLRVVADTNSTGFVLQSKDSGGALHSVGVDQNGRLGVGTVSPSYLLDVGGGQARVKNADNNNSPGLEVHMKPTITRPGFLLLENTNSPAAEGGSVVTHYASNGAGDRTQQGAYGFSWINANDRAARWELWQRCPTTSGGADTQVVLKAVPEDSSGNTNSIGKAFFRFGTDGTPSDRVHLVDGNLRLQRGTAAQKIRFFESETEDWIIEHKATTARELAIDAPGNRNLLLLSAGTGRVGVGEASPVSRLHVKSSDSETMRVERSGATAPGAYSVGASAQMNGDNSDLRIASETNSTGIVLQTKDSVGALHTIGIDRSGNVGVGRTDPSHPIHLASGAHVTSGGTWTNASSRDYKENIQDVTVEEAMDALAKLNPTKFNYKTERDAQHLGFIAEEVPDLVATKDRKGVSAMDVIAVLTKALQEQQRRLQDLEHRARVWDDALATATGILAKATT